MTNTTVNLRETMEVRYQWDLTPLFASDEAYELAYKEAQVSIEGFKQYEGILAQGSQTLSEALDSLLSIERQVENLYVYAHLKNDQDQTNATYQALNAKAGQLYAEYGQAIAFFEPELINIPADTLSEWITTHPRLGQLHKYIDNISRMREHILSPEQESLLASASEIFGGPQRIFGYLNNADFKFPDVINDEGETVQLTHGLYGKLIESTNRDVRRNAFEVLYSVYQQFENSIAQILSTTIKTHNFNAKIRGFESARQAALYRNNIPESVYDTLVNAVNHRLPLLHEYVALRKELLGLSDLEMYDLYTPLLGEPALAFTYEEAKEVTLKALAPLGEEYLSIIHQAFDDRWIDVYENKGKRSGAYSSGSYDSKPYVLMNWQDNINSLYTLVHELGHSAHSYLTRTNQPYEYGDYSIFLAEIASTLNENLLTHYLLANYPDKAIQRYVLNHFLDGLKGTVFRQTQFAEFEHFMHDKDAQGDPLTAAYLNEAYQTLNAKYYGESVNSNSAIRSEWSRIPHFYMNYYVFQYATGFSAAIAFADRIASGDLVARERYLTFLKSGSSRYPIDTMKQAGLDMTQEDYIAQTLDIFETRLNEFKSLL